MHTRRLTAVMLLATAMAGLLVAPGRAAPAATPRPAATPSATPALVAKEFLYEPKQVLAKAGDVTFTIKNVGSVDHDFVIEDSKGKVLAQATPFPAGKTVQVKAKLAAGSYTIFCSIPGHREAGMQTPLVVRP
jgi:uncharacterized cupredoxin-like copper-binding protein